MFPDLTFVNFVTIFHSKVTVLLFTIDLRSSITIGKRADRSSETPLSILPPILLTSNRYGMHRRERGGGKGAKWQLTMSGSGLNPFWSWLGKIGGIVKLLCHNNLTYLYSKTCHKLRPSITTITQLY